MSLPKVVVIMSTYNGEKYLGVQIESILAQKEVDVTLHIYDDCSKDRTIEIAKEYAKNHKNIFVHINEKNKNFTYNFLDALFSFKDNQENEYYAFADQDDYWVEDKLITAVNKIKETGECTLYSSNLKIVDQDLNYAGNNMLERRWKSGEYIYLHYDEICYNIVTGCTAVFDNAFKNLATRHYIEGLTYHDYWLALIANYCEGAHFVYDVCPDHILYRQHGKNMVGAKTESFCRRIYNFLFKKNTDVLFFLRKFYGAYGAELAEKDREIIYRFINYRKLKNKKFLIRNMHCNYEKKLKMRLYFNKFK